MNNPKESLEQRAKAVLANTLSVSSEDIGDDASPDNLEAWDSAAHMNLIMGLEEEFGVRFTDGQIVDLMSFELIVATLRELLDK